MTQRNAETISFNILLLQQIQKDGNLHHALKIKKGGKGRYFHYLADEILPLHFDPKEYLFHKGHNLMIKFNKFCDLCVEIGNTMHSTDSSGLAGETLDADIEMYIKMAANDEVPATKISKKKETEKYRCVQSSLIGNQTPLFGNLNRSQVATGNRQDRNENGDSNIASNLTPVTKTVHRRSQSTQKKKKNLHLLHPVIVFFPG